MIPVLGIETGKPLIHQFLGQALRAAPRRGEQQHPVFLPAVFLQIFYQQFKMLIVGADALAADVVTPCPLDPPILCLESGEGNPAKSAEFAENLLRRKQHLHLPRQEIALLQAAGHTLGKFPGHHLRPLLQPGLLIQKDQGILWHQIQEAVGLPAEIGQMGFQLLAQSPLPGLLHNLLHHGLQSVGLLGLHLPAKLFIESLPVRLHGRQALLHFPLVQHQLQSRIDRDGIRIVHRLLTLRVKIAQGIHLVPPQLDPDRILLGQGKNIQDPAPEGEFSPVLHLGSILIAELQQPAADLLQIQHISHRHGKNPFHIFFPGRDPVHQRVNGGNNRNFRPLQHRAHRLHALSGQGVSPDIRLVEEQIFRRIIHGIRIKETVLFQKLFRLHLIEGHNQPEGASLPDTIDQMSLLYVDTAGHIINFLVLRQRLSQQAHLLQLLQRLEKCLHSSTLPL